MIAPAPRKPIPVTICAAIRVGSTGEPAATNSAKPYAETSVKSAEPSETSEVRAEPGLAVAQLALEPDRGAEPGRDREPREHLPVGARDASAARSIDRLLLQQGELLDPGRGEVEQGVEVVARSNGTCSAVACTSTSRPSPVITTFRSTSAFESSE